MSLTVSIDLGPARPAYRVFRDRHDVDRLLVRFAPTLGRRVFGLFVSAGATLGVVEGARGDDPAILAAALAFASLGVLLAFFRTTLVLDRRRERVETLWGAPFAFARFVEAAGPFSEVALRENLEVSERKDNTHRETTYPVAIRSGRSESELHSFPTWESALDFAEVCAKFFRLPLEDAVSGCSLPPDRLDEPLALVASAADPRVLGRGRVSRETWSGEDALFVEIPRPGRALARQFLGLLGIVAILWTPIVLLMGGVLEAFLPLLVIAAAGVKLAWGYGAALRVDASGLQVTSRGLLGKRRRNIPLAELESIVLLQPEWGGPRSVLAHFFDGVLVARSDRVAVRFGHGLDRRELRYLRDRLTGLVARLGRGLSLAAPLADEPPPPAGVRATVAAWFLCGIAGARLGPPASACLNLPLLSVWLSALGVSGALFALAFETRDAPRADRPRSRVPLSLIGLVLGLWLLIDLFPGWIAAQPDADFARFRSAVERRPDPAAKGTWLLGLTPQQATTLYVLVLGTASVIGWVLAYGFVRVGSTWARRFRKRAAARLPLRSRASRSGRAPAKSPRGVRPLELAATLLILWSAAVFPDAYRPLSLWRAGQAAQAAAQQARADQERRARELRERRLLRLGPPPPTSLHGRPGLFFFGGYSGANSVLVEQMLWLRRAYAHADLRVVGFPADVHADALGSLLAERDWPGDHVTDAAEVAEYRSWSGFQGPGAYALLVEADGRVRERLDLFSGVEQRLSAWLGAPAVARPQRVPVTVDLRWSYEGRPVRMPPHGRIHVRAYDTWNHAHALWLSRLGPLPAEAAELQAESGAWRVRLEASALQDGRFTPAYVGDVLALLPAGSRERVLVEIPLRLPATPTRSAP